MFPSWTHILPSWITGSPGFDGPASNAILRRSILGGAAGDAGHQSTAAICVDPWRKLRCLEMGAFLTWWYPIAGWFMMVYDGKSVEIGWWLGVPLQETCKWLAHGYTMLHHKHYCLEVSQNAAIPKSFIESPVVVHLLIPTRRFPAVSSMGFWGIYTITHTVNDPYQIDTDRFSVDHSQPTLLLLWIGLITYSIFCC